MLNEQTHLLMDTASDLAQATDEAVVEELYYRFLVMALEFPIASAEDVLPVFAQPIRGREDEALLLSLLTNANAPVVGIRYLLGVHKIEVRNRSARVSEQWHAYVEAYHDTFFLIEKYQRKGAIYA